MATRLQRLQRAARERYSISTESRDDEQSRRTLRTTYSTNRRPNDCCRPIRCSVGKWRLEETEKTRRRDTGGKGGEEAEEGREKGEEREEEIKTGGVKWY